MKQLRKAEYVPALEPFLPRILHVSSSYPSRTNIDVFLPRSMLRKGQEGHVRAERDLLATASTSTRWTVRLAYSFQDVDHLYLVMNFMSGGGELMPLRGTHARLLFGAGAGTAALTKPRPRSSDKRLTNLQLIHQIFLPYSSTATPSPKIWPASTSPRWSSPSARLTAFSEPSTATSSRTTSSSVRRPKLHRFQAFESDLIARRFSRPHRHFRLWPRYRFPLGSRRRLL